MYTSLQGSSYTRASKNDVYYICPILLQSIFVWYNKYIFLLPNSILYRNFSYILTTLRYSNYTFLLELIFMIIFFFLCLEENIWTWDMNISSSLMNMGAYFISVVINSGQTFLSEKIGGIVRFRACYEFLDNIWKVIGK